MLHEVSTLYKTFPGLQHYNKFLFEEGIRNIDPTKYDGESNPVGFFAEKILRKVDKREKFAGFIVEYMDHIDANLVLNGKIDGVVGYSKFSFDIASAVTSLKFYNSNKKWNYVEPTDLSRFKSGDGLYLYPPNRKQKNMALIIQDCYRNRLPAEINILLRTGKFRYVISCVDKRLDRDMSPINPNFPKVTYLYMTTLESILKQEMPEEDFRDLKSKMITFANSKILKFSEEK